MAEESELEKKKKSWQGIQNALDSVLSGKTDSLLGSIIKDFTPNETTGKAPGISFGSIWKAIKFAVTHPIDTFNMIKLARSDPAIYKDPDFQKEVLGNQKLWDKVKEKADGLPAVGKMLDGFGIKEFSKDGILDQNGLKNIGAALKNEETLKDIKNIALNAISPNADFMKITSDGLGLLAKDPNMTQYLKNNGKAIGEYTTAKLTTVAQTDVTRTLDNISKDAKYSSAQTLLQGNPGLKNQFTQIIANNLAYPEQKQVFDTIDLFRNSFTKLPII
ncbi:hypothetical protein [Candidatus Trichorickettsia mobilis]|uniref:hypothetical protein n=1 Tax=Candidatus Trichorickettsia mobilis TaxID=1346319 RepID=UPI00292FD28C|nr:hypothetical protein [Candidatus Trichorickettsia mobilis]